MYGTIPAFLSKLPLAALDLSANAFSGTVPAALKALLPNASYGLNALADCGPRNGNSAECSSLLTVAQAWELFDGSGGGVWQGYGGTDYCRAPGPWPGLVCSKGAAVVAMCARAPAHPADYSTRRVLINYVREANNPMPSG